MTLVKWLPKRELSTFMDDISQTLTHPLLHPLETAYEAESFRPFINMNESDSEYIVSMDLPGVDKKDVEVNFSEGIVTVIGERKQNHQGKNNSCIWQETSNGTFRRSFELSNSVQDDKIKARFKNGVLNITIPKAKKVSPSVKKIAVS